MRILQLPRIVVIFLILFTLLRSALLVVGQPAWQLPYREGVWRFTGGPHVYGERVEESGLDFAPDDDTTVYPATPGTVTFVGRVPNDRRAGLVIRIDHGDGWETQYFHLDSSEPGIDEGVEVDVDTPIAQAGTTGGVPLHIHLELRHNNEPVDWDGLTISGWTVRATEGNYQGFLERGNRRINALTLEGGGDCRQITTPADGLVIVAQKFDNPCEFGINIEEYCRTKHYPRVGVPDGDAYGWKCSRDSGDSFIVNFQRACREIWGTVADMPH